jgi:hypothetical protein
MEGLLQVVLLGIIEGITEFLPSGEAGRRTSSQARVGTRTRATCRESPGDDGDDDDAAALWLVILSEKIAHSGRASLTAACT